MRLALGEMHRVLDRILPRAHDDVIATRRPVHALDDRGLIDERQAHVAEQLAEAVLVDRKRDVHATALEPH